MNAELMTSTDVRAAIMAMPPARQRAAIALIYYAAQGASPADVQTAANTLEREFTTAERAMLAEFNAMQAAPVDGELTADQRARMRVVLDSMLAEIAAMRADLPNYAAHLDRLTVLVGDACTILAETAE